MSDLQCPATVILLTPETSTSDDLGRMLEGRRLSGVLVAGAARETHELAAAQRVAAEHACRLDVRGDIVDSATLVGALEDVCASRRRVATSARGAQAAVHVEGKRLGG